MSQRCFIALILLVSAVVVIGALTGLAIFRVDEEYMRLHLVSSRTLARGVALAAEGSVLTDDRAALDRQLAAVKAANPDFRYLYIVRHGKVLAHTFPGRFPASLLAVKSNGPDETPTSIIDHDDRTIHCLSESIMNGTGGELHFGLGADSIKAEGTRVRREILMVGGLFLVAGSVFAFWLSGFVTATARRMRIMVNRLETQQVSLENEIQEHKRTEGNLHNAREEAEKASRAKSEFLANMSHEIRTPMNGILGMTELVLDGDLARDQREHLELVKASADSLLTVINDVLDFSKIEAGKFDLDPVDFPLRDDVGDALKSLALRAHRKGLELTYQVQPNVPDRLVGDSTRLRQILINLVGNAIKFTEYGEVVVRVEVESETDQDFSLHFSVTDTGIGIPADKLRTVFEPFTQADGSATRKYGGTGLGLTISTRLVELMGGRIWAESEAGKGSTFHFTVRLARATGAAKVPVRHVDLENLPVLVVDDNATNRVILSEILFHWHMKPTPVDSGAAAVAAMKQAAIAGSSFPLILLDAMMPDMDGFAVAEQIKKNPMLAGATILMLSSADCAGDAKRCREMGIARYLRKPVKQSELFDAILIALGSIPLKPSDSSIPSDPRENLATTSGWEILLAEDNEVNQHLAVKLLKKRGHEVEVVENGNKALAALERKRFDVILMDVQMPELDGLAATAAIRERERSTGGHIPIIALTAHAMKGDRERCLDAGMDAYLSKPLRPSELFAVMTGLLTQRRGEDPRVIATTAPVRGGVFDQETTLSRVEGDMELLQKMVQSFDKQACKLLNEIADAVSRRDGDVLERAAHKLKGSVGNFGAHDAFQTAQELETCGRSGDFTNVEERCAKLKSGVEALRNALVKFSHEKVPCAS